MAPAIREAVRLCLRRSSAMPMTAIAAKGSSGMPISSITTRLIPVRARLGNIHVRTAVRALLHLAPA